MLKLAKIIALSFFFSTWGDRLWNFAVALYLIKLTPGSLQLAAIYGLVQMGSAILFSPLVGDWIDRRDRLYGVRLLLFLSNLMVLLCAICILLYLRGVTTNENWLKVMQAVIIILGSLAYLAGIGEKICVGKDWIVVVCKEDTGMLANANALLRRIDLTVAILAPVGVGLLMTVISDLAGIIFICMWNVVTVFAEYLLLYYVYSKDTDLHQRALPPPTDQPESPTDNTTDITVVDQTENLAAKSKSNNVFRVLISGWKVYRRQTVVLAGVALSLLYLTVLGFSSITTSYAYSQGLEEVYISIAFGFGSLFGIIGTFIFAYLCKNIGLTRTGVVGGFFQLSMLALCVVSIWLPGSPSNFLQSSSNTNISLDTYQYTTVAPFITFNNNNSNSNNDYNNSTTFNTTTIDRNSTNTTIHQKPTKNKDSTKFISIIVLLVGIVLSRSGLWIADLTITQLQQENVPESERGTVGGVQNALNSIFELLSYVATICAPDPSQFWILVLVSISAVGLSVFTYMVFSARFSRTMSPVESVSDQEGISNGAIDDGRDQLSI